MKLLIVVICAVAGIAIPATSATAQAQEDDSDFEIIRARDDTPDPNASGVPPETGPTCTSRPAAYSRTGTVVQGGFRINYIDGTAYRISLSTGRVWARMYRTCTHPDNRVVNQYVWVEISDPDPRVLIEGTVEEVTERVYAPSPALSPVSRGVVNLGMWLAVAPQVPVTALATASPTTWAETTATMRDTTFDFGNGDSITCDGAGDPIPPEAKESIDQSPVCGYTYRATNGGEPFRLTITSRWSVVSTTSGGVVVNQPDIVLSTAIDYPVVEIQTVGASG
jgi:hypothetical protein